LSFTKRGPRYSLRAESASPDDEDGALPESHR
jgi:hypothetical protein